MNSKIALVIGASLGAVLSYFMVSWVGSYMPSETPLNDDTPKPLYWVAPMDDNYRRDKPGLSPMGMDLVPVYANNDAQADSPGTVTINPSVINNLGVRTAKVNLTTWQQHIETVGYVQYDQESMVHIHPRVEGWIETLYVKSAGDRVSKGQPLYTLYSPQLVNAQEEYLIALKRSNRALMRAAADRLRALQLSDEFIDKLKKRQTIRQSITFYASQSGVVDVLKIREGFYVKPGTTLMSLATLEQVWVEAEVFERDTALIEVGLPVSMTLDYLPNKTWVGQVDYIYPSLNATTRTLRVRLKFYNPQQQLKPNMFAQVSIATRPQQAQLQVPKEAVIRTGKQDRVVLALGNGQFKSVAVSVGSVGHDFIQIKEGLGEGDDVVTSAHFLIDSESSKHSDFMRMNHDDVNDMATVKAEVISIDADTRILTLDHGAIDAWNWPQMVMDFKVDTSVDVTQLKENTFYMFDIEKSHDNAYQVMDYSSLSGMNDVQSATVTGSVNSINSQTRVLNISRGPIEKWQRGPATMEFTLASDLDISLLKPEQQIMFTFEVREDLVIVEFSAQSLPQTHDQHNMEGMQHD
ncbi:efflux RND transporter periplasmic adaptor subunit [Pseudoalteromonas aurantia]|uniref:Efflux transporter periplasmic adaptor subunit n=1 Tax=Pseudoalteromonas aurantia TaxID=43654 RepID=A0ABY2VVX0_9GAMM|nr:efflux RND transporter periplasmic adaptor subunit [Pseudoalteromonas aurantia]TMO62228.1 efflux transporter periplasmic adaptor subunit [Pseudoalteromonas aurantia]TMO73293.1 efflux transporter periplasmic adaptor subunit [Pseudoalteromonas aurantia]